MTDRRNPLFKRRPTDQEIAAYQQRGLMRALVEKYPDWALEEGYIRRKEKAPGFFSRLFGRDDEPSIGIDEEDYRRRQAAQSRRIKREAEAEARADLARRQETARRAAAGTAAPERRAAATIAAPPPQPQSIVVEGAEATIAPATANEIATEISSKVSAEDIEEAIQTDEVQDSIEESEETSEVLGPDVEVSPSKDINASTGKKAKASAPKDSAPAKQSATGKSGAKERIDPNVKMVESLFPKGQWNLVFLRRAANDETLLTPLFFIESPRVGRKIVGLQAPMMKDIIKLSLDNVEFKDTSGRSRMMGEVIGLGDLNKASANLALFESVSKKTGNVGELFVARKGLFQKQKREEKVKAIAKGLVRSWPRVGGDFGEIPQVNKEDIKKWKNAAEKSSAPAPEAPPEPPPAPRGQSGQDAVVADEEAEAVVTETVRARVPDEPTSLARVEGRPASRQRRSGGLRGVGSRPE